MTLGGGAGGGDTVTSIDYLRYMDKNHYDNLHYNKRLQPFANNLRKQMTKAEACLWKFVLRAGLMKGYSFRRQRPVLNYIADFMCKELMLVIETDGLTHTWEETIAKDEKKELALKNAGFTVLRFTDNEVLNHVNMVRTSIEQWIEMHEIQRKS